MRRGLLFGALLTALAVVSLGVAQTAPKATPMDATTGPQAEVQAAIAAYARAISEKDIDACLAAYAPGTNSLMLGTGPGERWVGPEEMRTAHEQFFKDFDTESSKPTWRMVQVSGDVAWVAGMSEVVDYDKNVKNEFFLNISAVLQKIDGKWKIVQFHFSNRTDK
jgi:uncharacterized protein (TIGR02246 family)